MEMEMDWVGGGIEFMEMGWSTYALEGIVAGILQLCQRGIVYFDWFPTIDNHAQGTSHAFW